ncbi:hypothetical protein KUTeg_024250 [Tegillarca granosa]|uniref:Protein THEM6 n=1 Tax=Tegillarca granosa TaxID=220873 RepID=A0ABQ9E0W9_TEGGR|nr:hypothetical protein KUTeg_024250 [Tegillarca granosa]
MTTDLDLMVHMNNSRYLRECDFARQQFFLERRLGRAMKQLNVRVMNAGNNIRYRKSIEFLDVYKIKTKVGKIKTKILYWDDRAIYLEQQIVRNKDDFICAVNICKMCVIGCTPQTLLSKDHENVKTPAPSTELAKLLESWQLSSERLRKSV